ncbi:hypothetical protein P3X46_004699 [Hevea brasiliensis]|uniref:BZIP domain-containing protein n=1 Tax=Hevea brasiliensis TaxID=3981 RepID=A0ABQ9MY40_HEVBR|nr:bZIP transcription factor 17 [Hevea brasiliensis]KAJ9185021.1 hypothetical protein P3X46_004699 [Hevea brasiliensis]
MGVGDTILAVHPPPPTDSNHSIDDFDSLPIPPLDPLFLSAQNSSSTTMSGGENLVSDLPFSLDDSYDFDITFHDLDSFYFPSENEHFSIPNHDVSLQSGPIDGFVDGFTVHEAKSDWLESGSSGICGNHGSDVSKYLNCSLSESRSCNSADLSCNSDRGSNFASPISSQGSGNGGAGVSEAMNAPSPDSGAFLVDQKIKLEGVNAKSGGLPKRKKETTSEDVNGETRNLKYLRSENADPYLKANSLCGNFVELSEEEEKRRARLMRNRESAQLSRQRKKHYVEELEDKVRTMHLTIAELNSKISFFMAENTSLKQQLSGNGLCPSPLYPPMAPMPYSWVPCAPYVVKPPGSQVHLVPIPRLKTQQPVSAVKAKKAEAKKAEVKTKKVASVSFLGLLFFILLFGGLVPIVNVKFGGVKENGANGFGFVSEKFYDQQRGRVFGAHGHSNESHESMAVEFSNGNLHVGSRIQCGRGSDGCLAYDVEMKGGLEHLPDSDKFTQLANASNKPLAASLFVPRNDELVKIDGNLIIHSVLASEAAMASHEDPEVNKNKETGLAIPIDLFPALAFPDVGTNRGRHSHLYPTAKEPQKALTSASSDTPKDKKSSAADGKLQQWFHEGLAGPMLSSGMCKEVFQFDASPSPGAIIPASPVTNITAKHQQNATHHNKGKNRRILRGLPIPLPGSDLNITGERVGNSQKDNFQGNKSVSPMVVSVLVDPREAGDSEVDGVITPKSISRIFVVVLLDSVKYVTYSCVLPRSGPHLVTT